MNGEHHTHVMVMSAHSEHTEQVHAQTKGTNKQQLVGIHFRGIEAGEQKLAPRGITRETKEITNIRWMASNTINIEIKMRNIPFANPESVSILPYPYVNRSLAGQVAITEAISPTAIAIQSNAICIANPPPSVTEKEATDNTYRQKSIQDCSSKHHTASGQP